MPIRWTGSHPLIVTPMAEDGSVDEESLRNLIEFTLNEGAQGLITLGSTGEFFSLTNDERRHVIRVVTSQVRGRVPVGVGAADTGPAMAADMGEYSRSVGADYLLIPPPYYAPVMMNTDEGVFEFFSIIAARTSIPIMVYDGGSGLEVPLNTLRRLAQETNTIRSVKLNMFAPTKIRPLQEAGYDVFGGTELTTFLNLRHGANGFTIATAGVMPRESSDLHAASERGDWNAARKLFYDQLLPIMTIIVSAMPQYIASCKHLLHAKGVIKTVNVRNPLRPLDPIKIEELAESAKRMTSSS